MAVSETRINIPTQLSEDRVLLGLFQTMKDWTEKPRIVAVADLNLTVSNPPTQAEVQSIADKVDELLQALRSDNSNILDT